MVKKRTQFFLFFAAFVLYLILFPVPLEKEFSFLPRWSVSLDDPSSGTTEPSALGFRAYTNEGSILGYVSQEGRLLYKSGVYHDAMVHPMGFINYSRSGGALTLQDPQGRIIKQLDTDGFPLARGDWLFVITRDRKGLSRWSWEGEELWGYHFGALITTIDVQSTGILLGFLNGDVILISPQGEQQNFTKQRVHAVYGCALSDDQELFAVVTGLNPQVLGVYSFREGEAQLLWTRELSPALPRYRYLQFSKDSRSLFWVTPGGVSTVNWMGEGPRSIQLNTGFQTAVWGEVGALSLIFSGDDEGGELLLFQNPGRYQISIPLGGGTRPVLLENGSLTASLDRRLYSFQWGVR
jgi:hypothetical protein